MVEELAQGAPRSFAAAGQELDTASQSVSRIVVLHPAGISRLFFFRLMRKKHSWLMEGSPMNVQEDAVLR